MSSVLRRTGRLGALAAVTMLLSGCFLRATLRAVSVRTTGEEVEQILAAVFSNTNAAVCRHVERDGGTSVECTYIIASEEFPFLPQRTSTVELLSEFGVLGIFVDPVILQVPEGATNFVATFREEVGGPARSLDVTVTDSFAAQPGTVVAAEEGQQFVILELPADVASELPAGDPRTGTPFGFDLESELPELAPIEVKPMFALKIEVDGQAFYPPMLPCVTDFASVPSFEIPVSQSLQDLQPEIANAFEQSQDLACAGEVYDFGAIRGPLDVTIDVMPGSDRNPVNPARRGVVPVAVLSTSVAGGHAADFDATTVDASSVTFGRAGATEAHGRGHVEDVDGDGDDDLVLHLRVPDTGIRCGDTEAALTGTTIDGIPIHGSDVIDTVPCR